MKLRLGADAADCDTLAAGIAAELAQAERALERLLGTLADGDNSVCCTRLALAAARQSRPNGRGGAPSVEVYREPAPPRCSLSC